MKKQVLNRIEKLGGRFLKPSSESVEGYLQAIRFPHVLYKEEWDYCGIDKFFAKNRSTFEKSESTFFDKLEEHYFSNAETPKGQTHWKTRLFTPLTPGTNDYQVWAKEFKNSKNVNLSPIREIFGEGNLQFMQIADNYGYPDQFYVCLQDSTPRNPIVFGTDHEAYFREYSMQGSLLDFLKGFLTKEAFRKRVKEYLDI